MHKTFKIRLYPSKKQEELINRTIGCCRFVYNYFLSEWIEAYQNEGKGLGYNKCSAKLTELKKEYPWLREIDSIALQQSLKDLQNAFDNFFRERARGNDKWGYPRFKKKHNSKQGYRTHKVKNNIEVDMNTRRIKLPRLGRVKFRADKKLTEFPGEIHNVTVKQMPSGKYYAYILCELEMEPLPEVESKVGINLGIRYFAVLSNGEVVPNPKYMKKYEKKLAKLQRELSRKVRYSHNWYKAKVKVARQHEKISNKRFDFLHKLSTRLINENQVICLENLNIKSMVKNKRLAKEISDAGWGTFKKMLTYKAEWYGRTLIELDTFFPSSKLCSNCQTVNPMLTLSERKWQCPVCGIIHEREYNSAQNILNEGLKHVG